MSDAIQKLGEAARSGFKTPGKPKAETFEDARKGAMAEMLGYGGGSERTVPKKKEAPRVKSQEEQDLDEMQRMSDEAGGMSLEQAQEALSRRKKQPKPEVYRAIE